jgi:ABC-type antimicrobial peptide transport system permease subunit
LATALLADPLLLASQQALLAIAIAAILLALVGMLVSVATASERARDLALLDALGMPPGQVARMLALGQAMTAIATSAIGLLFGVLLSRLIVPAVTLTARAARPVPPLVVQVPWLAAAVIALVMAAVPTVAIMLTTPRAGRGAVMIRLESEA